MVWTNSPASDQTPSWRSSRLPSNSWRSFNRWPPRSQNLGYCCLVFPCSSTWRVWIFLLFGFVFAYTRFLLAACLFETQTTALRPVFDAWSTFQSLPGELPTLTTGANLEVPTMLGAHRIRLAFRTCLPLPFCPPWSRPLTRCSQPNKLYLQRSGRFWRRFPTNFCYQHRIG